MPSMEYCRHENTAREMSQVWDLWEDYETGGNDYEDRGRRQIIRLVREMHDQFEFDGTYDEVD
ncbi:hypothetical protein KR76_04210 [Pimelobacter simplex]|uniref:Uncharacterized protein n=2 Tax=Nocardioides simplex TaxID=2045 RepID=A0A0A1DFT5_NOCSI|nr:hypothetical protein KR76_04210 [Pimelobacter simplex]GEB17182.1 hypothetical protein NSI01_54970 [Pimelobacter simplex]SFN19050.1 hypothetical protein SAMN05421671_0039 [Pimelobacter simplex]